ncbi:MAG: 16S rRNA (cytosine(1402)-N(4))-methyltransferase RsmH [Planctomycetes bacterium]|nr:16S rRNA (cytosine(1402)-N(4))-methyltransferase RsmH [Planctomycetota bacterium]
MRYHIPVLSQEVIGIIRPEKDCIYVDATCGMGGHSLAILESCGATCRMICCDRDENALRIAKERLSKYSDRTVFLRTNYTDLIEALQQAGIVSVDSILLDLGVSLMQLEEPSRGFSFKNEGPLDMRMDKNLELTAYDLLVRLGEGELTAIFCEYGEEPLSGEISRAIVAERRRGKLANSTRVLADLICRVYGGRRSKVYPATRVFQALRIKVNNELGNLETALCRYIKWMIPRSKLVVVSYHSLEDRIVKTVFRSNKSSLNILTKKPVTPSPEEIRENRMSRSAKLRAVVKL